MSGQLLHHDAVALDLVQIELDRCGGFCRFHIRSLDRPQNFALGAQPKDDRAIRNQPLSMVATVGHAGVIQSFVAARMKRHVATVFAVHVHAFSDHA